MTKQKNIERDDFQDMYDAEEDMYAMELNLSQHSEDFNPDELGPGVRDEDVSKLTAEEQEELSEGPQEPEWACADMPLEQYDPQLANGIPQDGSLCEEPAEVKMAREMEELALAEPEPPEEDEDGII